MSKVTQGPPHVKPPRDVKPPLAFDPKRSKGGKKVALDLDPRTYTNYGVDNTIRRAGLRLWDNDLPNDIESPDPLEFCDPINIGDAIAASRRHARFTREQEEGISTPLDDNSVELASLFDTTKDDRQCITVYSYAASIDDAIQRIAERAEGFPKRAPGENPVLCVCIGHGAQALWAHPSIQRLVRVRKQELRLDWKEKAAKNVITELLRGFKSENGSAPGPSKKRNINVPESFANVFGMISTETKLAQSTLALISIMVTLCNQPDVQKEDRETFAKIVREYVSTIHYRGFAAETLLNNPEWRRICKESKRH